MIQAKLTRQMGITAGTVILSVASPARRNPATLYNTITSPLLSYVRSGSVIMNYGTLYHPGPNGYVWTRQGSSQIGIAYNIDILASIINFTNRNRFEGFPVRQQYRAISSSVSKNYVII